MSKAKATVIVSRKLPDIIETKMMELFNCKLNFDDKKMTVEQLGEAMRECDVFVPTVTDRIDRELIEKAAPRLSLIASFGTGVDHIDILAARKKGVVVTNTPDVLTEDTADMTMALILAVSRRLTEGERCVRAGKWEGWSPTGMLGHRIWGKRLGIIGMGRIGMALARRAKGFGLSVHYHNRNPVDEQIEEALDATYWPSLDQMLAHMDIISMNCPHTPGTYHLINDRRFKLMKPEALLINTSRGEVIDEKALISALKRKGIAGAGLDVFENEPKINPQLTNFPQVVALPHMGSATIEGRIDMGECVIRNIQTFLDGHNPPNRVVSTIF